MAQIGLCRLHELKFNHEEAGTLTICLLCIVTFFKEISWLPLMVLSFFHRFDQLDVSFSILECLPASDEE